jgi:hypothetical protein
MSFTSLVGARIPHGAGFVPDLLMHFDGDMIDATGNSTFTVGGTTGIGFFAHTSDTPTYAASSDAAFGQVAVTTIDSGAWSDTATLTLAGRTGFTITGWSTISTTSGAGSGGWLLSKTFYTTEPTPPPGEQFADWRLFLGYTGGNTVLSASWNDDGTGRSYGVNLPITPSSTRFHWAIVDDGTEVRFYCNGAIVDTFASAYVSATPPYATAAKLIVFGNLSGFLGSNPNWGGAGQGFSGQTDELAIYFNQVLYRGNSYTVPSQPYTTGA